LLKHYYSINLLFSDVQGLHDSKKSPKEAHKN